jgi:aspartate racemase
MNVEGIILGCTELPMLIKEEDLQIKRYDTMMIHAKAAAEWMLQDE